MGMQNEKAKHGGRSFTVRTDTPPDHSVAKVAEPKEPKGSPDDLSHSLNGATVAGGSK